MATAAAPEAAAAVVRAGVKAAASVAASAAAGAAKATAGLAVGAVGARAAAAAVTRAMAAVKAVEPVEAVEAAEGSGVGTRAAPSAARQEAARAHRRSSVELGRGDDLHVADSAEEVAVPRSVCGVAVREGGREHGSEHFGAFLCRGRSAGDVPELDLGDVVHDGHCDGVAVALALEGARGATGFVTDSRVATDVAFGEGRVKRQVELGADGAGEANLVFSDDVPCLRGLGELLRHVLFDGHVVGRRALAKAFFVRQRDELSSAEGDARLGGCRSGLLLSRSARSAPSCSRRPVRKCSNCVALQPEPSPSVNPVERSTHVPEA